VSFVAHATLTVTDRQGRKRKTEFRSAGQSTGERRVHLRNSAEGEPLKVGGLTLNSISSDIDIYGRAIGKSEVEVQADWYVDLVWQASGRAGSSSKPLKQHNIYRTDGIVVSGKTVTVTRSTITLPLGKAELQLELTPTALRNEK
jgi:hypothetical protein